MDGRDLPDRPDVLRAREPGVVAGRSGSSAGRAARCAAPVDFVLLSHDTTTHRSAVDRGARAARTRFVAGLRMSDSSAAPAARWSSSTGAERRDRPGPGALRAGAALLGALRQRRQPAPLAGWVVEGPTRRSTTRATPGTSRLPRAARAVRADRRRGATDRRLRAARDHALRAPRSRRAVRAAQDLRAEHGSTMHWGTFDLTDEKPDEPPRRFRAAAAARVWIPTRAWVLASGRRERW